MRQLPQFCGPVAADVFVCFIELLKYFIVQYSTVDCVKQATGGSGGGRLLGTVLYCTVLYCTVSK